MSSIKDILIKYYKRIDSLDLALLISAAIGKPREFILTHPEYKIPKFKIENLKFKIARRRRGEPLAYILGQKEFYGLEFKVDKNTLIPRPETEQIVENVLRLQPKNTAIIDVGTGSGNIIISLAKNLKRNNIFFATDISLKALNIAKQNSRFHKVSKKIKFLHGNLLAPIIRNLKLETRNYIIVANLPYLSKKIYSKVSPDIKNYEPQSALLSNGNGLGHYKKLFQQLKKLQATNHQLQIFIEISPEQKTLLKKAILTAFPKCHLAFFKDLAGKYRIVKFEI